MLTKVCEASVNEHIIVHLAMPGGQLSSETGFILHPE